MSPGSPHNPALMFIGDMHIGRNPIRLPPGCSEASDFGPARAWNQAVDLALDEKVAAVVLAGDVVDCIDDRFEAQRALEGGLARLKAASIPVFAVVGNHDVKALPRLARMGLGLELLGAGSRWQSVPIMVNDHPLCRLVGWSFSKRQQKRSPLADLGDDLLVNDLPNIGVLHCDVGQSNSPYAPVARSEFDNGEASRLDAWLLGHVHAPDHGGLASGRPCGYLGSLVGLDPGEPGAHGPWLIHIDGRSVSCEQRALGPLAFDRLKIDLTSEDKLTDLDIEDRIQMLFRRSATERLKQHHENPHVRALAVRLYLHGRTPQVPAFTTIAQRLAERNELVTELGGCTVFVESVVNRLRPQIDLEDLSDSKDALGLLSRLILQTRRGESGQRTTRLLNIIDAVHAEDTWSSLDDERHPLPPHAEILEENLLSVLAGLQQELSSESGSTR